MPFRCWLLEESITGWKRPVQRQGCLRKWSCSAYPVNDPEHRSHADGVRSLWDSGNTTHNLIDVTPVRPVGVTNDTCLVRSPSTASPLALQTSLFICSTLLQTQRGEKKNAQVVLFYQHVNWSDYEGKQTRDNRKKNKTNKRDKTQILYNIEQHWDSKPSEDKHNFLSLWIRVIGSSQENVDTLLSSNIFCFFCRKLVKTAMIWQIFVVASLVCNKNEHCSLTFLHIKHNSKLSLLAAFFSLFHNKIPNQKKLRKRTAVKYFE